jgi:hypothetical protein
MPEDLNIKTAIGQNSHFRDQENSEPHVDVQDEKCIKKWAHVLSISTDELLMAVKEFGPKIRKIRLGLAAREKNKHKRAA